VQTSLVIITEAAEYPAQQQTDGHAPQQNVHSQFFYSDEKHRAADHHPNRDAQPK